MAPLSSGALLVLAYVALLSPLGPLGLHHLVLGRLEHFVVSAQTLSFLGLGYALDFLLMPLYVDSVVRAAKGGGGPAGGSAWGVVAAASYLARSLATLVLSFAYALVTEQFWLYRPCSGGDESPFDEPPDVGDSRGLSSIGMRLAAYACLAAAAGTAAWLVGNIGESRLAWSAPFWGALALLVLSERDGEGGDGGGIGMAARGGTMSARTAAMLGATVVALAYRHLDGDGAKELVPYAATAAVTTTPPLAESTANAAEVEVVEPEDTTKAADSAPDSVPTLLRRRGQDETGKAKIELEKERPPLLRRRRPRQGRWCCSACCSVLGAAAWWILCLAAIGLHAQVPVENAASMRFDRGGLVTCSLGPVLLQNRHAVLTEALRVLEALRVWRVRRGWSGVRDDLLSLLSSEDEYAVLGLEKGKASLAEVKAAHRRLARDLHPDRLAATLSDAEREEATERFRRMQAAYETIVRELRGGEGALRTRLHS